VSRARPEHILVRQGTVTTCDLPHPMCAIQRQAHVDRSGCTAKIYNSDFELLGMPVFYFPFVTHPVQKDQRQTGLLIPSFGNSSTKRPDRRRLHLLGSESKHGRYHGRRILLEARLV